MTAGSSTLIMPMARPAIAMPIVRQFDAAEPPDRGADCQCAEAGEDHALDAEAMRETRRHRSDNAKTDHRRGGQDAGDDGGGAERVHDFDEDRADAADGGPEIETDCGDGGGGPSGGSETRHRFSVRRVWS